MWTLCKDRSYGPSDGSRHPLCPSEGRTTTLLGSDKDAGPLCSREDRTGPGSLHAGHESSPSYGGPASGSLVPRQVVCGA